MTECVDNPAERLHALLLRFCEAGQANPSMHNWDAWARALADTEPLETASPQFIRRIGEVFALPDKVRSAINCVVHDEGHRASLLEPLSDLDQAFREAAVPQTSVQQVWNAFAHGGDPTRSACIYSLKLCAGELGRAGVEPELDPESLRQITELVRELKDAILEAGLDPADATFVLDLLCQIELSVQEVRIRGRRGVEAAVDSGQGALIRRPGLLQRLSNLNLLEHTANAFNKIKLLLVLTQQGYELEQDAEKVVKMLTGGGS